MYDIEFCGVRPPSPSKKGLEGWSAFAAPLESQTNVSGYDCSGSPDSSFARADLTLSLPCTVADSTAAFMYHWNVSNGEDADRWTRSSAPIHVTPDGRCGLSGLDHCTRFLVTEALPAVVVVPPPVVLLDTVPSYSMTAAHPPLWPWLSKAPGFPRCWSRSAPGVRPSSAGPPGWP